MPRVLHLDTPLVPVQQPPPRQEQDPLRRLNGKQRPPLSPDSAAGNQNPRRRPLSPDAAASEQLSPVRMRTSTEKACS